MADGEGDAPHQELCNASTTMATQDDKVSLLPRDLGQKNVADMFATYIGLQQVCLNGDLYLCRPLHQFIQQGLAFLPQKPDGLWRCVIGAVDINHSDDLQDQCILPRKAERTGDGGL